MSSWYFCKFVDGQIIHSIFFCSCAAYYRFINIFILLINFDVIWVQEIPSKILSMKRVICMNEREVLYCS